MSKNIKESSEFKYHLGCKEINLSHMCFADDLLVLCNGNKGSLEVVKRSLDEFSHVSGLNPNLGKSIIFFGSIKDSEKVELLKILPFKCGKLPVRYLGVPLLSKKLSVKDCKPLIDKVEERVSCWRNKTLSYAGRIQLLASVLSSMQIYWASVYLLPLSVIKDLDKLFKKFLWNSGDSAQGKARVAWKMVCRPKTQGGLGIKPLKQWNEVLLIRKSIWEVDMEKSDSWGWKSMLKIRDYIKDHVCKRDIYDARIKDTMKVADMMVDNNWNWPEGWLSKFPLLSSVNPPNSLNDKEDQIMWVDNNDKRDKFSTSQAWLSIRDDWPNVQWHNVVWYSQLIPKHAFIFWLAIQDKLLTQDRMAKWKDITDLKCPLCKKCADSHDHLFFKCEFASQVWNEMLKKTIILGGMVSLKEIVDNISKERGKNSIGVVINKLVLAATVYMIWKERNQRLFRDEAKTVDAICNLIYEQVRNKLMTLKVKQSINVIKEASKWDLQWSNMVLIALWVKAGYGMDIKCIDHLGIVDGPDSRLGNVAEWDCFPEQILAVFGEDLSENRSFTSCLVMPPVRASMIRGWDPLVIGRVFVEENVARHEGFSMVTQLTNLDTLSKDHGWMMRVYSSCYGYMSSQG
ncbi:RNA-directed DNA polymerase, eukaryota, reverse transcriptase zinc-binding domain protein [Tanacetum coccineum]|uniref:RNA-directed DNA polymerase, eukaryota, reverse transcriptase zinc-binding domain protein n=1 Tax=Tanacetum coccineum TaxID=301880 RepID=A0ABQ5I7T9_9ASTR